MADPELIVREGGGTDWPKEEGAAQSFFSDNLYNEPFFPTRKGGPCPRFDPHEAINLEYFLKIIFKKHQEESQFANTYFQQRDHIAITNYTVEQMTYVIFVIGTNRYHSDVYIK